MTKRKKARSIMKKGKVVVSGRGRSVVVILSDVLAISSRPPGRWLVLALYKKDRKRSILRRAISPKDGALYSHMLALYIQAIETGGRDAGQSE